MASNGTLATTSFRLERYIKPETTLTEENEELGV